jgi:hypothetical protein
MERDELLALMAAMLFPSSPGQTSEITARIAVDTAEFILKEVKRRSSPVLSAR